jgi:hypothetical protein
MECSLKWLTNILVLSGILLFGMPVQAQVKFIHEVLEYTPAPGQFINKEPWGHPSSAQSIIGSINGSLSLGVFGGYVVFRFDTPVINHADNPYGIDFIIFGNPFSHFSEPGIVSVMKDENGNGLPDDTWYELAGSDYFFSSTLYNHKVTYQNPGGEIAKPIPWSDNLGNNGIIEVKSFHTQPYYPSADLFPHVSNQQYELSGTRIRGFVDLSNPGVIISRRRRFGYTDNTVRGKEPWDFPGNPYSATPGNAGGDGFDISWAVDQDGNYVDLDKIHFIKVHTAILDDAGWLGEISTEITGAVMVSPGHATNQAIDIVVIKDVPPVIYPGFKLEAYAFRNGRIMKDRKISWITSLSDSWIDDENTLHAGGPGQITIQAYTNDNPAVYAEIQAKVEMPANAGWLPGKNIFLSPNPARDRVFIKGIDKAEVAIFDMAGTLVRLIPSYSSGTAICTGDMAPGVYVVRIVTGNSIISARFSIIR